MPCGPCTKHFLPRIHTDDIPEVTSLIVNRGERGGRREKEMTHVKAYRRGPMFIERGGRGECEIPEALSSIQKPPMDADERR